MAVVKAPLLSLGASGKLAGTLVATTWKGLKVMREYVKPANPQTADQMVQRGVFADSVSAWRMYLTDAEIRTAWNKKAQVSGKPQSGFNAAVSSLTQILAGDPDASYVTSIYDSGAGIFDCSVKNMDDGATGDEAGDFELWTGHKASSLLLLGTQTIVAGIIEVTTGIATDEVVYIDIRKDGFSRSGIMKGLGT